jgi:hypothetical protein
VKDRGLGNENFYDNFNCIFDFLTDLNGAGTKRSFAIADCLS